MGKHTLTPKFNPKFKWSFFFARTNKRISMIVIFLLCINVRETEEVIKNGQSRETGNIGYTRRRQTQPKTQHNMC
jgi:hypothetical protein